MSHTVNMKATTTNRRGRVPGAGPFNIQRPVSDRGQTVPSRSEALQRMQEEYELKRLEFEEKQREKEAKKRDQRLAKYQHVDQGHRLNEAYLDEAAGFDYGYFNSEEEVRFRQQDQLRRDALAFQEREREESEQRKMREEEKQREFLNKNKHIDAGYKLGRGGNQGPGRGGRQQPNKYFKPKNEGKKARENNPTSNHPAPSISPELLLEGESYEEALARQEEQLLLEALILSEQVRLAEEHGKAQEEPMKKDLTPKEEDVRNTSSPGQGRVAPRAPGDGGLHQLRKDFREADQLAEGSRSAGSAGKARAMPQVTLTQPQSTLGGAENMQGPQEMKEKLMAQLETLMSKSKSTGAPVLQDQSISTKPIQAEAPKPASCILKNSSQGAVLVLRPTEEALNQALATRPEVQDEMDKYGDSALYKPCVERAPLYSNNRFEQKSFIETVNVTGAMPKVKPVQSSVLPAANTNPSVTLSEQKPPDEPMIDHQAEMRAARLRMQQKYEESLRKQQEDS